MTKAPQAPFLFFKIIYLHVITFPQDHFVINNSLVYLAGIVVIFTNILLGLVTI
jgi:hypothetical protein